MAVLAIAAGPPASAFTFVRLADEGDGFALFDNPPAISDGGEAAFYNGGTSLLVGTPAALTRVAGTSCSGPEAALHCTEPEAGRTFTALPSTVSWPSINNHGSVAFHAQYSGGEGIYRYDPAGTLTKIVDSDDAPEFSGGFRPEISLNNSGTVAFVVMTNPNGVARSLYTGNGGPLTLRADTIGAFSNLNNPSLNDGGTVSFQAGLDSGDEAVATDPGGIRFQTGDSCGGFIIDDTGHTSLNDRGELVFGATSGSQIGILAFDGSSCTFFLPGPFAGQASITSTGSLLWHTGPVAFQDGVAVITPGEALCGGSAISVGIGRESQNDRGWVAFRYATQTGAGVVTGVALAVPPGDEHFLGPDVTVLDCAASVAPFDQDGDGEPDSVDQCPATIPGAAVDEAGCSQAEFCNAFDVSDSAGRRSCRRADWQNDEPVMRSRDRDCVLDRRGTSTRADDLCEALP